MGETAESEPSTEVLLKAREDLVLEREGGKFILNDPIKNTFVRLGLAEYLVFRYFDGESTKEDIVARLKEERDVTVKPEQLDRLSKQLSEKQLLLAPGEKVNEDSADLTSGGGFLSKIILIDFGLVINPDRWLLLLFHRIKYICFRPAFFVFFFLAGFFAILIWLSSWTAIQQQSASLEFSGGMLILFWVCLTVSLFLHEIGHGVATKGFGGKVPRMGAFFYFFMLAWYMDVSASYMFQSKFRKQMVLMAGPMVTFFILFLTTIGWRLTIQGGPANTVFFVFMNINAVATIATLAPLIRGDGYYMICTWLDMPNLTQNSKEYVGASIRKYIFRAKIELPKADRRQARIYWRWSLIQTPVLVMLFLYMGLALIVDVVNALEVISLFLFGAVLYERTGRPLHKFLSGSLLYLSRALRLRLTEGGQTLFSHLFAPVKALVFWFLRFAKIAIPVVLICLIPYEQHVVASFRVVSIETQNVRTELGGILRAYEVRAGDRLKIGAVIARLDDRGLLAEKAQAQVELHSAQLGLELAMAGSRPEEIAIAKTLFQSDKTRLAYLKRKLARAKALEKSQAISPKELSEVLSTVETAMYQTHQSSMRYRLLKLGTRPEEVEIAQAHVLLHTYNLKEIDRKLNATVIRSPWAGIVVTPQRQITMRIGQEVIAGESLLQVVDDEHLVAEIEVPTRQLSLVKPTSPVELRSFLDPESSQMTTVQSVFALVPTSQDTSSPATTIALAEFNANSVSWSIGTTGVAKLSSGKQPIYKIVYAKVKRKVWVELWSWL